MHVMLACARVPRRNHKPLAVVGRLAAAASAASAAAPPAPPPASPAAAAAAAAAAAREADGGGAFALTPARPRAGSGARRAAADPGWPAERWLVLRTDAHAPLWVGDDDARAGAAAARAKRGGDAAAVRSAAHARASFSDEGDVDEPRYVPPPVGSRAKAV